MIKEKEFEDILCKYPGLIEPNLELRGRQLVLYGRRIDLLFEDKFKRKLIIELKVGPIKDEHIGQILAYEGMLLSAEDPTIRVMLVGNRVPPNIQKSLDHHGIAWKEIPFSKLKEYLSNNNDSDFLKLFDLEVFSSKPDIPKVKAIVKVDYGVTSRNSALFSPILKQWIDEALEYFSTGKERLYFYTNSGIGAAANSDIKSVYFKQKGDKEITFKADFVDLVYENPDGYRLPGPRDKGKYFYGFRNLRQLKHSVPLIDLKYFKSGKNLSNDVPGACIIFDPKVE